MTFPLFGSTIGLTSCDISYGSENHWVVLKEAELGNTIVCKVGAESILLDIDSNTQKDGERNRELWRAETYETKEPDTIEWIDSFFREGDVIYDIGANIGQYSLYAAKKLKGNCRILAFEPEALNYSKLNKNIVLNNLTDSITA